MNYRWMRPTSFDVTSNHAQTNTVDEHVSNQQPATATTEPLPRNRILTTISPCTHTPVNPPHKPSPPAPSISSRWAAYSS
mmetsp:Transcript_61100/g.73490  ORF Transcript_61100/g.73490 Transcript_61100/m.73490 type:complete len:80 (+) Transcript_61100:549-788(+)